MKPSDLLPKAHGHQLQAPLGAVRSHRSTTATTLVCAIFLTGITEKNIHMFLIHNEKKGKKTVGQKQRIGQQHNIFHSVMNGIRFKKATLSLGLPWGTGGDGAVSGPHRKQGQDVGTQ